MSLQIDMAAPEDRAWAQSAFDRAVAGLAKQGWIKSSDSPNSHLAGGCRYRLKTEDGVMVACAIGQLLTDEQYRPWMDQGQAGSIGTILAPLTCPDETDAERGQLENARYMEEALALPAGWKERDQLLEFMTALQNAHDESSGPASMRNKLRVVATRYNLVHGPHLTELGRDVE